MAIRKWAVAVAGALALGLASQGWAVAPGGDQELAAWVDRRVQDWLPTPEERRFDEIGWARDIRTAERLAKEHGRPVFLFTYDGVSLANYRC